MNESEFESELRSLRPAAPSPSLEGRMAAALPPVASRRSSRGFWLAERLLWTAAGALAAWLVLLHVSPSSPALAQTKTEDPVPRVSDESLGWSDDGVQLIDGDTPARMLRRHVMERHQSPDGRTEIRVPREDVFLVPVALR
ncbi:MAG TPA: hypothetical protein VGH65_09235 [Verrucomicrobiaceae bacterium]